MANLPPPTIHAIAYRASCLPQEDDNAHLYSLLVEEYGNGRWAVTQLGSCLGADGTWDWGVKEHDRGDAWLDTHRFDLATALQLAKEAASKIKVNGIPVGTALKAGDDGKPEGGRP